MAKLINRRKFLIVGVIGTAGFLIAKQHHSPMTPVKFTIDKTLENLVSLMKLSPSSKGNWDLPKIFNHCAQSIELSMTNYPEHKSKVFKATVGALAFTAFKTRGSMTHSLIEPIPGADHFKQGGNLEAAFQRLVKALNRFKDYEGALAEHFAYGK